MHGVKGDLVDLGTERFAHEARHGRHGLDVLPTTVAHGHMRQLDARALCQREANGRASEIGGDDFIGLTHLYPPGRL